MSKQEIKPPVKSPRQEHFEAQRKDSTDREIQMEMLYAQQILVDKIDKVRGNTNTLIWWLIAIPIILVIMAVFFGGLLGES